MPYGRISTVEALDANNSEALIGITDLLSIQTANGTVLFTAGRGGSWVTAFDVGGSAGATEVRSVWQIPEGWLQLESTDLVYRTGAGSDELLLAGLGSTQMLALQVTDTAGFSSVRTHNAAGNDLGAISQITAMTDGGHTLAGLRAGGLVQAQFQVTGQASITQVNVPAALAGARVDALDSLAIGSATFAVAAFGAQNSLALLSGATGNALSVRSVAVADTRVAFDGLSDAVLAQADGALYAIAAASGTGSLTVFAVDQGSGGMTAVDFVLDSRDTRFADVSFLKAVDFEGVTYLVAAGSDQGLTLLTLLPGGQLHVLDSLEGTFDLPLNNITDVELALSGSTLRIWASTMAAPYLAEFSVDLSAQGSRQFANAAGGALSGTAASDTLWGGDGADQISGGAGDDIIYDGAGSDVLNGGAGSDVFVFSVDDADDTITGFERGVDRIDLTRRVDDQADINDVQITTRSWGAELRYDDQTLAVYSADGDPLRADEFQFFAFVTEADRVSLAAEITYPGTGSNDGGTSGGDTGNDNGNGDTTPPTQFATNNDDLLLGGADNDALDGMRGDDRISGRDGADAIWGRGGNDTIVGGGDGDRIQGGDGDDVIYGDDASVMDWV